MPIIAVQVPKNHDPAASAIDETAMTSHEFNGDTCRLTERVHDEVSTHVGAA